MDRGTWRAIVHGVAKSRTRLSDFTFTLHCRIQGRVAGLGAERGVMSGWETSLPLACSRRRARGRESSLWQEATPVPGHFHPSQASDAASEISTRASACCESPPGNL